MVFENSEIDLQDIPQSEDVLLTPIDKNYYKVLIYNQIIVALVLIAIASMLIYLISGLRNTLPLLLLLGGVLFTIIASYRLNYLSFQNKAFAVREHDIIYQTGWFIKQNHICPISRIQHCSIHSGVFERKFGLCKLLLYTAGGVTSDIKIPGLRNSEAEKIRSFIVDKIKLDDEQ